MRRGAAPTLGISIVLAVAPAMARQTGPAATDVVAPADDRFLPDRAAPFLSSTDAWPTRLGDNGKRGHAVVVPLDARPTSLAVVRVRGTPDRPPTAEDKADIEALRASLAPEHRPGAERFRLEGANAIVFQAVTRRVGQGLGAGPGPDAGPFAGFSFKVISGTERPDAGGTVDLERTWFVWYDAIGENKKPDEAAARAALVMPGLFGNPEPTIDRLVKRLRTEGYGVLRMLAQPSRFTERVEFGIDAGDLAGSSRAIAEVLGGRAAECAYAVERAWDYAMERRPSLRDARRVVIGMSGGAISLPTVVARNPGRYAAAVIIAGSADFWLTNERSNYRSYIDALRVRWTAPPTGAEQRALDRAYLDASPLDNFHTAGSLHARRVLILQGLIDQATPSDLGDVLWERAGRPERWTYPVGHELLFAGLPQEFDRLMAWLNADGGLGAP